MPYNLYDRQEHSSGWLIKCIQLVWPIVWLLSRPFVLIYRIADQIFDFDARGAARNLKRLTEEVESDCDYLFSRYGGRIVPELSSGSPSFDFATVVIEVRSLQLRAIRDRGFTSWEITSTAFRSHWESLETVCARFAPKTGRQHSIWDLLIDHLPEIEQSFANSR